MARIQKQKTPKGTKAMASDLITDPRFSNIHSDPRYRLPSKRHTHVKLDHRFARMLDDDDFSRKASVDRYGRRLPKDQGKRELERFYRLEENEEEEGQAEADGMGGEGIEVDDDKVVRNELARVERTHDPAREGGFSSSESSTEDSDDDITAQEEVEDVMTFPDMAVEEEANVPMGEVTSRLAIVNLDWDNIRAVDLMAVFSSFCPSAGKIRSVSVYPSEYGKECMQREETEGPPKEIFAKPKAAEAAEAAVDEDVEESSDDDVDEDEDEEIKKDLLKEDAGEEFDPTSLRNYQLSRLRYYYAVLSASSSSCAKALYDATDGTEYLTTANFFDLRFIPDEVSFAEDEPRDSCTGIPDGYKPNEFVTDALQHSKVKLTWDQEDVVRKEVVRKAFAGGGMSRREVEDNDLRAYLGSDSEDEMENDLAQDGDDAVDGEQRVKKPSKKEAERQRLREALGLSSGPPPPSSKSKSTKAGPVGDMQITFTSGLGASGTNGQVFENEPIKDETTVEKYVRREKERKARRREKMRASREGGETTTTETTKEGKASHEDAPDQNTGEKLTKDDDAEASNPDLGFADPFFEADPTATKSSRKTPTDKATRLARREARLKADADSARQRADLELLMLDEGHPPPQTSSTGPLPSSAPPPSHFDMKSVLRAEKERARASKSKRKAQPAFSFSSSAAAAPQRDVPLDDPRFDALYENPEFALDPTNPRFVRTEVMTGFLEEGRKRRRRDGNGDGGDGGGKGKKVKEGVGAGKAEREGMGGEREEVRRLVEKVRAKGRR
ncbi:MAG: pre-rRNA-processing protein esf1 [Caeruleum heppii]|nr:MAG: pre-rRNA-processing protein esf1 [Caeruleum heppii]